MKTESNEQVKSDAVLEQEHHVFMEISTTHISLCNIEPHSELKLQNISFDYAPFHKRLIISRGGALVTEIDLLY